MKYFVYMDDYGSYYREHGFKEPGYNSYEDVVLGLEKDARAHDVPIGAYFVLDADQIRYQEGLFEPQPTLFPHGIPRLREQLGKPLQCYILWLAPGGPYRKQYPFVETEKRSGPASAARPPLPRSSNRFLVPPRHLRPVRQALPTHSHRSRRSNP